MPVTRIAQGCPEWIESKIRGGEGFENRACGRPIYMNGVCNRCWQMNEQLRGEYNPMQANPVSERIDTGGYERLYVEDTTLLEKGLDRDVQSAMVNFEDELQELLG